MLETGFVTRSEYQKHIRGEWRTVHDFWRHIRHYMTGYAAPIGAYYTKAETDAFFEGYSGGGKAQVDAGNVVGLTQGSIPFADASGFLIEDNSNLFWNDALNVLEVGAPTRNTYIGKSVVGAGNSTGSRNVYMGFEAGLENTIGLRNVFIGYMAGHANLSGNFGTIIGYQAGYKQTTAHENTLVGINAGWGLTTSPSNTCLGADAGLVLSTGTGRNTLLGNMAGNWVEAGYENTFVGRSAGVYTVEGYRNTCIGFEAQFNEFGVGTDPKYRIAIGYKAYSHEDNLCAIGGLTATDSVNLAIFYNREFRFYDAGDNYVGFKAPALVDDQIWVLPAADGAAGGPLITDGAGNLDFAVVTKQIYLNNAAFTKGATAPTQVILGNLNAWEFDIGDDAVMTVMLPPDWAAGTLITIKVCWYIDEAYAADKEVQWRVDWSALPHDFSETVDAPTHSGQVDSGDIDIPAVAKRTGLSTVGTIAGASLSAGDMLGFTLSRIAVTNDDPTADPAIHHLMIEYTADKLGTAI